MAQPRAASTEIRSAEWMAPRTAALKAVSWADHLGQRLVAMRAQSMAALTADKWVENWVGPMDSMTAALMAVQWDFHLVGSWGE